MDLQGRWSLMEDYFGIYGHWEEIDLQGRGVWWWCVSARESGMV